MTSVRSALCVLVLAAAGRAQQTPPAETIGKLSQSAEQQLAASITDLNRLREQVAAEKLPLAQELTAAEEQDAQSGADACHWSFTGSGTKAGDCLPCRISSAESTSAATAGAGSHTQPSAEGRPMPASPRALT